MGGSIVFARLGQYAPHLIHAMLPCTQQSPHPKRYLDRFSRFSTTHGIDALHFTMGCPFPLKIALSHRGIWVPSNACFLGRTRLHNPNGISIGSAVFAGLTTVSGRSTDPPTDRPRYSACNNRPHLRTTVQKPFHNCYMRPNNNSN